MPRPHADGQTERPKNQRRGVSLRPLLMLINPALLKHADQRRQSLENRIADQITRFAGSTSSGSPPGSSWASSTTPTGCSP
jgi:hypothetical protein